MPDATTPPVPRIVLGMELAFWRSQAGKTGQQAAAKIGTSVPQVSKIENGLQPISEGDLVLLLELYDVPDTYRPALVEMARATQQTAWLDGYRDVLAGTQRLDTYLGLELAADRVKALEIWPIHGLLQTEEYASATIRAGKPEAGRHVIDRLVALRMERKAVLERSGFQLHVILDEAALRRPMGGDATMLAQLRHLRTVGQEPNVTIQVIPRQVGAYAGTDGPFSLLTFARRTTRPDEWNITYVGSALGNLYETRSAFVLPYLDRFDQIEEVALSSDESDAFIADVAEEFT